jgi:hypothetical protein
MVWDFVLRMNTLPSLRSFEKAKQSACYLMNKFVVWFAKQSL